MFTVEMDHDETIVTVLDDVGIRGDVSFFFYDDMIYIRQFDEKKQKYEVILMSPEMWEEFMTAWKRPEGAYVTQYEKR
jgi:predicted polyphosphate/ATP-dependent NAD kinase